MLIIIIKISMQANFGKGGYLYCYARGLIIDIIKIS